jgi:ectoine hydroxylase-related dioxygenase (phytanoyl-CoA dioxygenase family)
MNPTTIAISDENRRQYHEEGYYILPRVIAEKHLALLRDEAERAVADVHREMDEKQTDVVGANHRNKRYFILWHKQTGRLGEFLFADYITAICRATLGDNAYLFYEQYVIKTEKTGVQFSWHQDSGYVRAKHQPYVSCWCALDDVNESNGTVYVLPYSRAGVKERIEHKQVGTDMVGYFGSDPGTPVIAPAGSIAVFSSVCFHRSGPNTSENPRRVYLAQYSAEPMRNVQGNLVNLAEPVLVNGQRASVQNV